MPAKKVTLKSTPRKVASGITSKKAPAQKKTAPIKAATKKVAPKEVAKKAPVSKQADAVGKAKTRISKPAKETAKKTATPKGKITVDQVRGTAAFAKSKSKATDYAKDPKKLGKLFEAAAEKAKNTRKGPFGETWAYLQAMIRLLRAYSNGSYRDIPWGSLLLVVIAVVYFVSPVDAIPDVIPVVGYLDDAVVVAWVLKQVKADLDAFMEWELSHP